MKAPIRKAIKQVYAKLPCKRPLFEIMRRTMQLPPRVSQHLSFRGPFSVKIDGSHRFRIQHWGYLLETNLFWNGLARSDESTSLEVWRRIAPHAGTILDIGANTGVYALVARCVNPAATIIAMEPVRRVFQRLQHNIALNEYEITALQMAASDTSGTAPIYDLLSEHEYTASLSDTRREHGSGTLAYDVATTRVDDFLVSGGFQSIDLIKIDVEQFEPQVLRGLGSFLPKCKPALLIEVLNARVAKEVSDLTSGLGYNIFQILEGRGLLRRNSIVASETADRNYLLVQDDMLAKAQILDLLLRGPQSLPEKISDSLPESLARA